ncbi:MAG TPA: aldo/keto reductase, partial [Alphaproteobacteria bacterium]|nr:aldo/keto reductase [Alphaproteobacteria bacterium]
MWPESSRFRSTRPPVRGERSTNIRGRTPRAARRRAPVRPRSGRATPGRDMRPSGTSAAFPGRGSAPPLHPRHAGPEQPRRRGSMKAIVTGNARIPALGLGTWQLQGKHCADCVADALAAGYRHVDTAQRYDNHEAVGAGLRRSGLARDEVFLTSKLWFEHLRRDDALASMEQTLKELGTDYVDLMLIHWPNPKVPLEETLEAMQQMREKGWIRHVGVSNFPPSWLEEAAELAPIVCDQVEYHPLLSQGHLLDALRAREIALIAYSPLAHGEVVEEPTLVEIGRAHDRSAVQV